MSRSWFRCCVPSCLNNKRGVSNVNFFSIPLKGRAAWLEILKINPNDITSTTRVCMRHFKEDDFFHFSTCVKLKPHTIPSINLHATPQEIENVEVEETLNEVNVMPLRGKKRLRFKIRQQPRTAFYIENFKKNDKLIYFYTGVQSYKILIAIFRLALKNEKGPKGAVNQTNAHRSMRREHNLTPLNELFLTLMRLRRGFEFQVLANMFLVSKSAAGKIFTSWINLLFSKFAGWRLFPPRDVLLSHASNAFKRKYPNVIGSIDCTEFVIQTPKSLVRQSQCYSHYKGATTLKALIMINPQGAVVFVSPLFTGSISDKKIVEDSNFLKLLKRKVEVGQLHEGDIILADKGFEISDILANVGLNLNIPTFRVTGLQYSPDDVDYIRKIAHERVHVERAIRRIKTFKILSNVIPISALTYINQIFFVCVVLTLFMNPLVK